MAKATFRLDNGKIVTLGVPDGTTADEAGAMFEEFLATPEGKAAQSAPERKSMAIGANIPEPQAPSERSLLDKAKLYGRAIGEGAVGILDPISEMMKPSQASEELMRKRGIAPIPTQTASEGFKQRMQEMGAPAPTQAESVPYAAFRGAGSVLPTLGAGGLMGAGSQLGKMLMTAPATQLMAGGASGAASQGMQNAGAGPGGQLAAGLAAGVLAPMAAGGVANIAANTGTRLANAVKGKYASPEITEALRAGERFDVPVLASDVSKSPTIQRLATVGEKIPGVGLIGPRLGQHDKAKQAALELEKQMPGARFGELWGETVQKSQVKKLEAIKKTVGNMYDNAEKIAGNTPINPTNTITKLDELINAEKGQVMPNNALIGWMEKAKKGLAGQEPTVAQRMQGTKPGSSFPVFRTMQDDLQEQIRGFYNNSDKAVIASRDIKPIQQLKNAMDADLEASLPPKAWETWKNADKTYKQYAIPFKSQVAKISTAKDPVELYAAIEQSHKKRPGILYHTLDRDGKDALLYGVVKNALEKSIKTENGNFSPQKFASEIQRQHKSIAVNPDALQREKVEAFSNLMGSIPRAGQFREHPPTGNRTMFEAASIGGTGAAIGMATGGAIAAPAGAVTAMVGTAALGAITRVLFTTEAGKRLLLAAKRVRPNTPAMDRLAAQALALASSQNAQSPGD